MVINVSDALAAYRNSGGVSTKTALGSVAGGEGESFAEALKGFAHDAVDGIKAGEKATIESVNGKADLASVVTAVNNAEMMLQTVVTIRDKVISAYQDITRTQI